MESAINLILSLVLIQFIGIYGVLIGTIVALVYRANDIILYTNKHIYKRSAWKEYKLYLLNFVIFACFAVLDHFVSISANTYFELFGKAIAVFLGTVLVFSLANIPSLKASLKAVKKNTPS